jgi:hypothetical protein
MTFTIEKNIPVPNRVNYPFDDMKDGDSFFIKLDGGSAHKISCAVRVYATRKGVSITTRTSPEGVRVWKTGTLVKN